MARGGQAYVFINYKQAAGFGHVAWGVRVAEDEFIFGSTDHLYHHNWWDLPAWVRYMHVPPEGDIDWWMERGRKEDMLHVMRNGHHIRYHAYKTIDIDLAYPDEAVNAARRLKTQGWNVARHNCVHHTFTVLSEYTKEHGFPDPFRDILNLMPKRWFNLLPGELRML